MATSKIVTFATRLNTSQGRINSLAALREAARQGSDLAAIELIKKKLIPGGSGFREISRLLDGIVERVNFGVKVGDPISMYTLAVMKSQGLGVALDLAGC